MVQEKSNEKLDKIIKQLEKGFDTEKLPKALMDIREDALQDEDPLLAKVLRLAAEYITEEGCFDHTVEKVEDDEGEEELVEPGTDAENLSYLLQLLKKADNKWNREEIKEMRTFLKLKLY
ncbi:hypothetical protein K6119_13490 [Paracrocinitomix mangrovi]|uniref:hypothetical protein n=1 Tax=Paracrocinitomix mangrovi TaxID=2862509 RepID=UPI001C8E8FBA|nr:hypothetical protein [Paracrocinitomix mangrovi]UKN00745.1 hypothetical protein K6119_13490 [Paracrocinitomix mangrovi]